jgi:stage II sporulation protein D
VDIEDYLKGVLPGELGPRANDEYEAVKAQAITARTYAIWRLTSDGSPNQLKNTIEDQLYLGAGAEMPLHSRAVEETKGMIMLAEGKPVAAYYHAVCGGSTAPREKVWGGERVPYLRGVDDDGYCQWAKSYSWKENFTYDDLNNNINQYISALGVIPARGFGKIIDIGFKLDKTIERMSEMKVITTTGEYSVFSDKIRWALKRPSVPGAILPSTRFSAKIISDGGAITGLELEGTGNGHGVGMCQCGAIGRARKGVRYSDILKTYYRGIKIEKLY